MNLNIDLAAEKKELDEFLSKCLEMQVREDAPKGFPQPQESPGEVSGPEEVEQRPSLAEPLFKPEPLEVSAPETGETPALQAAAGGEAVLAGKAAPAESGPEGEISKYPDFKQDIHTEEFKPTAVPEVKAEALQPEPEVPRAQAVPSVDMADAGPDAKPEPPQAKPDLEKEIPVEMRSPYLQDKSSLRKPSRNAAAMAYAEDSAKKKKRLLVAIGIFVAFLIGIGAYLYKFPIGNRATEIISGKPAASSSQEKKPAKAADSNADTKADEGRQIQKKINRGGT